MTNPTISEINAALLTLSQAGLIKPAQTASFARKAEKLKLKAAKLARQNEVNARVSEALADILKEDGSATQHRAVWVAVGREDHTRDEVLTALQSLRSDGVLKSFKKSGNNFQVFWARVEDEPAAPEFETNSADEAAK